MPEWRTKPERVYAGLAVGGPADGIKLVSLVPWHRVVRMTDENLCAQKYPIDFDGLVKVETTDYRFEEDQDGGWWTPL